MRFPALFLLIAATALGQPTVAPTHAAVGSTEGETLAGYNVRQSFELGYRFRALGRGEDLYRGFVNFGSGVRLLGSSLSVQSREGQGSRFDRIQLDTQGLGNDPYQNALLRVEKNRFYRYDLRWRSNAYFNPGLANASNAGYSSTVRNWQDHDVVLFPQRRLQLFAGFSRNTQAGPAITGSLFQGASLGLSSEVRRQQHEYRTGFETSAAGWRLNVLHGWVNFQEEAPAAIDINIARVQRVEPYRGNSPYWRLSLFKETRLWAVNARFTYVKGQRRFVQDETGVSPSLGTRQVIATGDAQRPAAAGNLNFSWFPAAKFTVINQSALSHIRMSGSAALVEVVNGVPTQASVPFQFLGVRMLSNSTVADYRPARWFGTQLGYQYSTRRIRSIQELNVSGPQRPDEQDNGLHTVTAGVRLRPSKTLTMQADGELGRADRPLFPVSGRNFQAARGRIEYRRDRFRLAAFGRMDYNVNSTALANFASRSRQYGADGTWTLAPGAFLDVAYAKLRLETLGALFYFTGNASPAPTVSIPSNQSYYISNLHTAHVAARFAIAGRAELSLGFSHTQDTGGFRASAFQTDIFRTGQILFSAQQFPMRFTSPLASLSVRLRENLRWNLGYQHYGYAEPVRHIRLGGMRAHTGYSSMSWSF